MFWFLDIVFVTLIGSCHWLIKTLSARPGALKTQLSSFGGGAAISYVFLHIFPEIAVGGAEISKASGMHTYIPSEALESLIFLVALIGAVLPYLIKSASLRLHTMKDYYENANLTRFALINYLYAYSMPSLLTTGYVYALSFTIAIAGHVLLSDRSMLAKHQSSYYKKLRWIGSLSLVIGTVHTFALHPISELNLAYIKSFIGGSLITSVLQEEIPKPDSSRVSFFLSGLILMTAILITRGFVK